MCEALSVKIADQTGLPYAQVPREAIWALVEFLSFRRTLVVYSYQATHFTVEFLRMGQAAAQSMLDEWSGLVSASVKSNAAVH